MRAGEKGDGGRGRARERPEGTEERRALAAELAPILAGEYPDTTVTLDHTNPLELLVATILSAQCTDERVNRVTSDLFRAYRTAEDYAEADRGELEERIRPTGFYRNKAKHLQGMARKLIERHDGRVPGTMDELTELPGVARKTANVVLTNAFGKLEGVVVDTHVKRVARRLGLTDETDAGKVERDLMEALPRERWGEFAWRLILHGRSVCTARAPACAECPVNHLCPSAFSFD